MVADVTLVVVVIVAVYSCSHCDSYSISMFKKKYVVAIVSHHNCRIFVLSCVAQLQQNLITFFLGVRYLIHEQMTH